VPQFCGIELCIARSEVQVTQIERVIRSWQAFKRELRRKEAGSATVRRTFGVALGGGFARGLAHIGVLKVLEQENLKPDFVAGTSVGSILGAAYCSGLSAAELEDLAGSLRFRDFVRFTFSRYGFCSADRMDTLLKRLLKCQTFEGMQIPLAVAATNIRSGDAVVFRSGQLYAAVRASCAYPGMFPPVEIDGELYVDGMLGHAVPTTPLRTLGAECVLGVYLNSKWIRTRDPRHMFDVITQCFNIAQTRMSGSWRRDANVVIEPDVSDFAYDCFDRAPELVRFGEEAMRAALPEVKRALGMSEMPVVTPPSTENEVRLPM
jgi:NTE family protein